MILRGIVRLDLTTLQLGYHDDPSTVKGVLWSCLRDVPDGADVRLIVPKWDWWAGLVITDLWDLAEHVGSLTVESVDPDTVRTWLQALHEQQRATA